MKDDILEQVVEDYLQAKGYFTRHNLKFRPRQSDSGYVSNQDSVASDIDVIAIHPRPTDDIPATIVVSCKSWQEGFNAKSYLKSLAGKKKVSGREAWRSFRELTDEKWASAFCRVVKELTGNDRFTYVLAVAHLIGDASVFENNTHFRKNIGGNPIKILTFKQMLDEVISGITTTPVGSVSGRLLQLIKASRWKPS